MAYNFKVVAPFNEDGNAEAKLPYQLGEVRTVRIKVYDNPIKNKIILNEIHLATE